MVGSISRGSDTSHVVHDFFTPQPIKNAAVFLLRIVLHDWPDKYARKILIRLREAANKDTKLVIADFVMPLACVDDFDIDFSAEALGGVTNKLEDGFRVKGASKALAPWPLLANLGKASANVYWMDITVGIQTPTSDFFPHSSHLHGGRCR